MTAPDAGVGSTEAVASIATSLRLVRATLPFLTGLAAVVSVELDERVGTAGVTASGRVLLSPRFWAALTVQERTFVLAHELLHLALDTHGRMGGQEKLLVNFAHDLVINDMLVEALACAVPAGGLHSVGARHQSLERLVTWLKESFKPSELRSWRPAGGEVAAAVGQEETALGRALRRALGTGTDDRVGPNRARGRSDRRGDVIDRRLEEELFPAGAERSRVPGDTELHRAVAEANSLRAFQEQLGEGIGADAAEEDFGVAALRTSYRPPWELALQRWFDYLSPGERSFARPSRRAGERVDVVLPGRRRENWTLHLVLDTSGSMVDEQARVLGVVAAFCQAAGVESVHIVQCDAEVARDEMVAPEELERYTIRGCGGSDMTPAMALLAEDPLVEAVIVVTDGDIAYPEKAPPYQVLWVITGFWAWEGFDPGYGHVIQLEPTRAS